MDIFLQAYEKGLAKVDYLRNHLQHFPHTTRETKWLTHENGHWTGGFWTGLLWLQALESMREEDFKIAKGWAMRFKDRIRDNKTHDQGFIYGPSCLLGYNILRESDFIPLVHAGANNMVDLYNPKSGLILAWDEPGYEGVAIVDTVMNIPLMWISDTLKGETSKKALMQTLANNILKHHVRPDFSTYHVAQWDEDYNMSFGTHQGASDDSCWSRGQAWSFYGFANVYRYSRDKKYLDVAANLAEYFYNHLNANHLPAWDFTYQDNEEHPIDAAAASIGSAGMLLMSFLMNQDGDHAGAKLWEERAKQVLTAMIDHCLYKEMAKYGIIENVTVDFPRGSSIGESAMYGDYYFMEALYRLQHLHNPLRTNLLY